MGREYVTGEKQEPGDRQGPAHKALQLDFRSLEEQREDAPGTVTITPAS